MSGRIGNHTARRAAPAEPVHGWAYAGALVLGLSSGGCGGDVDPSPSVDPAVVAECRAVAQSLAGTLPVAGTCDWVVRFDWRTLEPIAHATVCGAKTVVTPNAAIATAVSTVPDTKGGILLSDPSGSGQWLFYRSPSDFGGLVSVSAGTGLVTFASTVVWLGLGHVTEPTTWSNAALGTRCPTSASPAVTGYDLLGNPAPLAASERKKVVAALGRTAIFDAVATRGTASHLTIFAYARAFAVGTGTLFDESSAEYVAVLSFDLAEPP